jgi:signal transduction histidine kinase
MSAAGLRGVALLEGLPDARLEELAAAGEERTFSPGELLFHEGDPATHFMFLLEGELETTKDVGGDEVVLQRHVQGGYLGAIALLTDTPFRATTRAVTPARLYFIPADTFHRLVLGEPSVRKRVFSVFAPVMQNLQGVAAQREKLVALGGLAAGLAHELNNPAAAAGRAAGELGSVDRERREALSALLAAGVPPGGLLELLRLCDRPAETAVLDPLEASEREDELADALARHGLGERARLAAPLVDAGLTAAQLDELAAEVEASGFAPAVRLLAASLAVPRLLEELTEATGRISALVHAVKQYSYLDRAPRQDVDVNEGIRSTLTILGHKLKQGDVSVATELAPELPGIHAFGSELNQLWTNLIDNAIDAVAGAGTVRVASRLEPGRIVVEVEDDGPGIPEDVQARIFEPFFTTKPVGKGTGLGLDIAQRIVIEHRGELTVESRPGRTRFTVRLPLRQG